MNTKKVVKYFLLTTILTILPAKADIVWPSLYITKGMLSLKVIIFGLMIELLFVRYFTKISWKMASITAIVMNLITTVLGIILIPLFGLGTEFIFDCVFHAYDKFGIGTFHWSHWLVSYLLVILINTFIECLYIKLALKLKFRKTFRWMLFANAISVFLCFLFLSV